MIITPPDGRTVYIAGQVAWDSEGRIRGDTREEQFRIALDHLHHALDTVGGLLDDVQSLRIYIPDFQSGAEADVIARVLVDALAQPDYLIEVEATAVVPEDRIKAPVTRMTKPAATP